MSTKSKKKYFHPMLQEPQKDYVRKEPAGRWVLAEEESLHANVTIARCYPKPSWLARVIVKWLLGWEWAPPCDAVTAKGAADMLAARDWYAQEHKKDVTLPEGPAPKQP